MIKHYVEYTYAGSFFSENSTEEIVSRNQKITLPCGAYAYRIFDREEVSFGGETLKGSQKNFGPRHVKGDVYDIARVENEVTDNRILLANMRGNGWDRVVKCAQGFIPMYDGDVLIPA